MIDLTEIRNVIRARIFNSGIIPSDCFAWENIMFEPHGKDLWLGEDYLPATGIVSDSKYRDEEKGILQFTVYTPINSPSGDTVANNTAKLISDLFTTPEVIEGTITKASIVVRKSNQSKLDNTWYVSSLDFNYSCYSK